MYWEPHRKADVLRRKLFRLQTAKAAQSPAERCLWPKHTMVWHKRLTRGPPRGPAQLKSVTRVSNTLRNKWPTPTSTSQPPGPLLRTRCVVEEMVWPPGTAKVLPSVRFEMSSRVPKPATIDVLLAQDDASPERISRFRSLPIKFRRRSRRTTCCGGIVAHD